MKTRNRLLSGFLALTLCVGLISPALADVAGDLSETENESVSDVQEETPEQSTPEVQPEAPEGTEGEETEEPELPEEPEEGSEEDVTLPEESEPAGEEQNEDLGAAPQADPVTLTASLVGVDGALSVKDEGRVRLNTTGQQVVVDTITYKSSDESKLTVDENGVVTVKEGYVPTQEETVTVTVEYSYYSGSDVKYVENFDDNTAKPFSNTNYAINDGQSRTGLYGVTPYSTTGDPATKEVGPFENVRVTAWYYDPNTAEEQSCTNTMKFGFAATHSTSDKNTNQLGVFFGSGTGDGTKSNYGYRAATSGNFADTGIARFAGWHKLEWVVTGDNGTVMYIDGTEITVGELASSVTPMAERKQVANLTLATNWCGQNSNDQAGMNLLRDHHYIDDISIVDANATAQTGSTTVTVTLKPEDPPKPPALTFGQGGEDEVLSKGESGRVYLDNMEDYAIAGATYTSSNPNVIVDEAGNLTIKDGYVPQDGETVTVTATVTYYDKPEEVIFSDSFEGDKQFDTIGAYNHTTVGSLFGRSAATATTTNGYPAHKIDEVTDVTVTAWYYDEFADSPSVADNQVKFGFSINGNANGMGIFYDGTIAALVNGNTRDHYGMRVSGTKYNAYSWGGSNIARSQGWHKFEWVISDVSGMTMKIDGQVVSTHQGTVGDATAIPELTPVKDNENVKSLTSVNFLTGWSSNGTNSGYIRDRHFIDGVTVVKTGASTKTVTLTSEAIPVLDIVYTHTPENPTVDSTYPKDLAFDVTPNLDELGSVQLDGKDLTAAQWHVTTKEDAPQNASYYPTGRLVIYADAFKGLTDGNHTLTLVMTSGSTHAIAFKAQANTHVATNYYLSNSGNDNNDGHTEQTAWATFEKLSTVTFGPGDHIYLDATSTWSNVQFRPVGSGVEGKPIVMTSYGGDGTQRPILNGDGTVANKDPENGGHSYLAFDAWRKFYPSGTIELFNVEQWEIRGLEITNYSSTLSQGATGRNGIAVIHDYFEIQGITTMPSSDQAKEEAFFRAGKLQHIVIEDCYIHDVNGYHPNNGATGAGCKMSGGINLYGPYDGLSVKNNIVMYCDVEGIRNDVLAWRGDTRTQFPCYMEDIDVSNNFILGIPGDGVVLSSAIEPTITHNYLADAGYSYLSDGTSKSTTAQPMGNRDNPVIYKSANFAGLWFIGTMDAVAEFNESVNNVWTCNDGEAFDADMFCWGTVFQYNYTYRNNGGFALIMGSADRGTIMRYNVSIEDGEGIGSGTDQDSTFHYAGAPDAIYNNLFVLGNKVESIFGGGSNTTHFFNNIVVAPNGLLQADGTEIGFHINGSSDGGSKVQANPKLSGEMTNNIFYPAAILDSVVAGSSVRLEDNVVLTEEEVDSLFHDLSGFIAKPVNALNGRSTFDDFTTTPVTMISGKGAGVAISASEGRKATSPDGTNFDYTQFEGIKTLEGSPAIGAGVPVVLSWDHTDKVHPLTKDFFQNDITGITTPDIGPYQWSADANHYVKVTLESNGSDAQVKPVYATVGGTVTLPTPVKTGSEFKGWYESADFSGSAVSSPYTVTKQGITLYAKWEKTGNTVDVLFDTQGGSYVAPKNGLDSGSKVTKPAADPTMEGFKFLGWYKDAQGTTAWDFDADTVTADTTIYAKWQALYYTVKFDRNGGDTGANPSSMQVTLPATSLGELPTAPTRDGYEFTGWNTAADGTGTAFTADTKVTANLTVYAQWKAVGGYSYTVTYNANGGSGTTPASQTVESPATTVGTLPTAPTRTGYDFTGWNTKADGTGTAFTASTVVTGDLTVYAQWKAKTVDPDPTPTPGGNGGSVLPPVTPSNPSTKPDPKPETPETPVTPPVTPEEPVGNVTVGGEGTFNVSANEDGSVTYTFAPEQEEEEILYVRVNGLVVEATGELTVGKSDSVVVVFGDPNANHVDNYADTASLPDYMADAVNYVVSAKLFQGVDSEHFAPSGNMNRAMFATVLARLYGANTEGLSSKFADVNSGSWYEGAVAWAADMGFVNGVSGTEFAPTRAMTRQELVTMIYRFAQKVGVDVSARGDLSGFADREKLSGWAEDAMAWAVGEGLIKGRSSGIAPGDTITRGETAIILQRMATLLTK